MPMYATVTRRRYRARPTASACGRGDLVLAALLARAPRGEHFVPEESGEEEGGRYRPVGQHALVGLRERQRDEALAQRLLEDYIEQRQHAVVQADVAQLAQAGAGV